MHTVLKNIPVLPSLQMWFFTFWQAWESDFFLQKVTISMIYILNY